MQLKQFFEKISICIITRIRIYSVVNLDFWIISILVAYDGKRGYRDRTGKTCIFSYFSFTYNQNKGKASVPSNEKNFGEFVFNYKRTL